MNQTGIAAVNPSLPTGFLTQGNENLKERIYSRIRPDLERIEAEIDRIRRHPEDEAEECA